MKNQLNVTKYETRPRFAPKLGEVVTHGMVLTRRWDTGQRSMAARIQQAIERIKAEERNV